MAINVRMVTELAWHNLFIRHLLRRPERDSAGQLCADFTVINCPSFQADPAKAQLPQRNCDRDEF
jgi:phosphoenolpyruvate carboxykinase (ATP)